MEEKPGSAFPTESTAQMESQKRSSPVKQKAPQASDSSSAGLKPIEKLSRKQLKDKMKHNPTGGYDSTSLPTVSDGYTVKFTIHRAENLPMSDLRSCSTDAFVTATLTSALPKRHKEDPDLCIRTQTIHKDTDPKWEAVWTVAGIPSSGCRLKCRIYDEDPANYDDRLGNVSIYIDRLSRDWQGIKEQKYDVKKRMGSKRAYLIRACAAMINSNVHIGAYLYMSAEVLGDSGQPYGRMYTLEETYWFKHFSPMIGRIAGTKAPNTHEKEGNDKPVVEKYDFQANQMQLQGPVPAELYHRFVEFKPFVKGMFSKVGIRGRILNKALHHQHNRVYNFSSTTKYGVVRPRSREAALQFLKLVHFDEGARIFTYVLTLDGLLRFTETGKEFGIDLLSKHTMHSDVNVYIACSGEFFVRRLRDSDQPTTASDHVNIDVDGGKSPLVPEKYKLVIDNDSGTYRPKGDLLPLLKTFLSENFPGLQVVVKGCTDKTLARMKKAQVERKKDEGNMVEVMQGSDSDSTFSSSDEEVLEERATSGKRKKSRKQRVFDMLEDPRKAVKELFPGEKGSSGRPGSEGGRKASGGDGSM